MTDLTAKMVFVADATGVEAGVDRGKRSLADLGVTAVTEGKKAAEGVAAVGKGGDQAAAKLDAATRNMIASIQRTTAAAETGKKSGSEYFAALANQRGIPADVLKPYLAQLDSALAKQKAAEAALNATAPALGRVSVSAAQTANALRGVPAQITDIITSLQGGQAPLTVFLQQGGQLKDMFGGIGPAARAVGGYVLGLVNPFTVAAAAVGALALAYYKGSQETVEYNKALILTGNYAGQTAGQLQDMAKKIADGGATQGKAAEALTALASTGRVAGDALLQAGEAVVASNRAMGTSIKDAVAEYVKLGEDPAKASAKLNESLHYLTQSTYEQIKALEDQGRKEEAGALAQATYAAAMKQRSGQVVENLGSIERALKSGALIASQFWDALLGVGRSTTMQVQLADVQRKIAEAQKAGEGNSVTASFYEPLMNRLRSQQAVMQAAIGFENGFAKMAAERAKAEQAGSVATDDINKWQDKAKGVGAVTRELEKYRASLEAVRKVNPNSDLLKPDAVKAGEDAIRKEFAGAKGAAPKAFQDDAATKLLETLRQTEDSLKAQLDGESKLSEARKKQVEFEGEIARLKGKDILTADQKSLLANQDAVKEQLKKNVALSDQVEFEKKIADITKKSAEDAKQFRQMMDGITASMESGQQSRDEQSSRSLAAFGLGDRTRQEVEAQRAIRAEFQRYSDVATRDASKNGMLNSEDYKKKAAEIRQALEDALTAQNNYFEALKAKEADWTNGATTALANYADSIRNVSASTERAFSDGFRGAEDALVKFVTTGKGSVKGLADSIIADLARIGVQQMITGPLAKGLMGAFAGDEFGDFIKAKGFIGAGDSGGGGGGLGGLLGTFGKWFGGLLGFADGGNPPVGVPSIVGERGPEIFIPSVPGTIIPNHALGSGSGGSVTNNNYYSVGDIATVAMLKQALAATQAQTASRINSSRTRGGALA